jgi:hypothetical protein
MLPRSGAGKLGDEIPVSFVCFATGGRTFAIAALLVNELWRAIWRRRSISPVAARSSRPAVDFVVGERDLLDKLSPLTRRGTRRNGRGGAVRTAGLNGGIVARNIDHHR